MALDNLISLIDKLEKFDSHSELQKIVENNTDAIAQLQKEQMSQGLDGSGAGTMLKDNAAFGFGYRPYTVGVKQKKGVGLGAVTDRVTGFMTGDLYRNLKSEVSGDVFVQSSDVSYFDELLSRTGDEWAELNERQRRQFAERVTVPEFAKVLLDKTGIEL